MGVYICFSSTNIYTNKVPVIHEPVSGRLPVHLTVFLMSVEIHDRHKMKAILTRNLHERPTDNKLGFRESIIYINK